MSASDVEVVYPSTVHRYDRNIAFIGAKLPKMEITVACLERLQEEFNYHLEVVHRDGYPLILLRYIHFDERQAWKEAGRLAGLITHIFFHTVQMRCCANMEGVYDVLRYRED